MDVLKRNSVNIAGQGKRVLMFSHGFGCDQSMWRFVTPAFEKEYKIVLFDHIGFGKSDFSTYSLEKYSSLQAYADDVLEICEALSLQNVTFIGHSVGSVIGILAAIKAPAIFHKLILVSPSPCYLNDGDYKGGLSQDDIEGLLQVLDSNYLKWAGKMAPVIMGNDDRPELSQELEESFCKSDRQIAKDFARLTFLSDNRSDLPKLQTQTLILQCSDDLIASVAVGRYMHQNIKNSDLAILNAQGHCPNLSEPEATVAAIKGFLEKDEN